MPRCSGSARFGCPPAECGGSDARGVRRAAGALRRVARACAFLLLCVLIGRSCLAPGSSLAAESSTSGLEGRGGLAEQIDALLAGGLLAEASVGIWIERAEDGALLYARGGEQLFIPASNQKLLTAIASLARFGPAHRFSTRTWAP